MSTAGSLPDSSASRNDAEQRERAAAEHPEGWSEPALSGGGGSGRASESRGAKAPLEQALVAKVVARPEFTAVYDEHFAFVWRSLRRLAVPHAQLDDAAQDTFLIVYRRLAEFEGRSSLKTWLFGIVLRVASTHRRAATRRPTEPLVAEPVDPRSSDEDQLGDRAVAARTVRRLLDELADDRRVVFVLAELEQMTAPEIAASLGVNLNTVYSRLRLARRDFEAALARLRSRSSP